MRIIDRLLDKDISAGTASATVVATLGLFGVLYTGIWMLIPLVYS